MKGCQCGESCRICGLCTTRLIRGMCSPCYNRWYDKNKRKGRVVAGRAGFEPSTAQPLASSVRPLYRVLQSASFTGGDSETYTPTNNHAAPIVAQGLSFCKWRGQDE